MAGKVCGDAYAELLKDWLKGAAPPNLTLRLYSNNYTPVLDEEVSDFTESGMAGYAAVNLVQGNWTVTDTLGVLAATYPAITFTFTGGGTIYGYFVTDVAKTLVYWAELGAGGPFIYSSGGGQLIVTLEIDGPAS
jgi:hypothetical protein